MRCGRTHDMDASEIAHPCSTAPGFWKLCFAWGLREVYFASGLRLCDTDTEVWRLCEICTRISEFSHSGEGWEVGSGNEWVTMEMEALDLVIVAIVMETTIFVTDEYVLARRGLLEESLCVA